MSTTVNLGMLPQNRGQFTTATWPQNISIYKDNIVQYNGSSYIYNPASFDIEHPEASATSLRPYSSTPATLNTGWAVFASGNNTFTTGQSVDELSIDAQLSHTSSGIPSSSEVFNKFIESGVFDLSAYNAVGGELATYVDLGAALTAMNSLSTDYKKGGMSVKFVRSSDNNYVQYRYMGTATTGTPNPFLDEDNWQGVDDIPTSGSDNLVKSGGMHDYIQDANDEVISILESGTLDWESGFYSYSGGTKTGETTSYKRTRKFKKELESYISHYEMCGTQTSGKRSSSHVSYWLNGVYVGYLLQGVYKDGQNNVVQPENFEYDSFALNVYATQSYDIDYLTYYTIINLSQKADINDTKFSSGEYVKNIGIDDEPTLDSGNLVRSGSIKIFEKEILFGTLVWNKGFRKFDTGEYTAFNGYRSTNILDKSFESLISNIDKVGTTNTGVSRNSHKSLFLNDVYVGYLFNGKYYNPSRQEVQTPIEYDTFVINEYVSSNPNYATYYTLYNISKIKEDIENVTIDKFKFDRAFYALGDSTTAGAGATTSSNSWANVLSSIADFTSFSKLAVSGSFCVYHEGYGRLSTQIANVPQNTTGIVTIMIGTNDFFYDSPLGDSSVTLAKAFSELNDTENFADAYRYNLETLRRRCPDAIIICMTPLPSNDANNAQDHRDETNLHALRQIQRDICSAMGIPLIETAKEFGMSRYTDNWNYFFSDFCHPNDTGYQRIAHCMLGKFVEFCQ